jgi:hypothetical protein
MPTDLLSIDICKKSLSVYKCILLVNYPRLKSYRNMPQEVKETIKELFSDSLAKKGTGKWFRI